MNVNLNSNRVMLGSFASNQKDRAINKDENKNSTNIGNSNSYSKMIESIQEQMKKVQENDAYDVDMKKSKMEELQKQLEEIRKMEQEEKTSKLTSEKKVEEDKSHAENSDGDKLTLSEEMENLLKDDVAFDKLKSKNAVQKEMKGEVNVLKREIEVDKGRGANTERKEDQLSELKDRIKNMDNNELEKMNSTKNSNNKTDVPKDEKQVEEELEKQNGQDKKVDEAK